LFIGDSNGEIASILKEYTCGVSAAIDDVQEVVRQIRHLSEHPSLVETMGAAARRAYDEKYNQRQSIEAWRSLLNSELASHGKVTKVSVG
jgi:glycosyltransferase involved in cell wall biosynthesis